MTVKPIFGQTMHEPAQGTLDMHGRKQIAVRFTSSEFNRIAKLAYENKTSFAEQVRRLIKRGMEP